MFFGLIRDRRFFIGWCVRSSQLFATNQADVLQMAVVGGFGGDRIPWWFPEPEPVTVTLTDCPRVQPKLTQYHPWMFDPEIPRRARFGLASKDRDKPLRYDNDNGNELGLGLNTHRFLLVPAQPDWALSPIEIPLDAGPAATANPGLQ